MIKFKKIYLIIGN